MGQHFGEVKKLANLGEKSDSFAEHVACQFEEWGLTGSNLPNDQEGDGKGEDLVARQHHKLHEVVRQEEL